MLIINKKRIFQVIFFMFAIKGKKIGITHGTKEMSDEKHFSTLQWLTQNEFLENKPIRPTLENTKEITKVVTKVKDTAILRCQARNLDGQTISWLRTSDYHVLASGNEVYIKDDRFAVYHKEGTKDWILQIKGAKVSDSGQYECQVPIQSGLLAKLINLDVVVPRARILGNAKEYFIDQGSSIVLNCTVMKNKLLAYVSFEWHHNNTKLSPVDNERILLYSNENDDLLSTLIIENVKLRHSGNYSCNAPETIPDSIFVYVTQGHLTAAIQERASTCAELYSYGLFVFIFTNATIAICATIHNKYI